MRQRPHPCDTHLYAKSPQRRSHIPAPPHFNPAHTRPQHRTDFPSENPEVDEIQPGGRSPLRATPRTERGSPRSAK